MHYSIVVCVYRYILFTDVHCIGLPEDLVQLLRSVTDGYGKEEVPKPTRCVCVCVCVCV